MIRLIACDIDGTLLPEGSTGLEPAVYTQIRRLSERGVFFCPASGRPGPTLQLMFPASSPPWPAGCPFCAKTARWSSARAVRAPF